MDNRRGRVATAPTQGRSERAGASLGPTLTLAVTLAIALFVVVMAVVELTAQPTALPPPLRPQKQSAESALYLVAFAAILPAALVGVPRMANAVAASANARALPFVAALLAATLAASILVLRMLPHGGVVEALGVVGAWWLGAIALLARCTRSRPWKPLARVADTAPLAGVLAGGLALAALAAFTSLRSVSPLPLAIGGAAVLAALIVSTRGVALPRLPGLPRRAGFAVDAAVVILLLLAIPNLALFEPGGWLVSFKNGVAQWHHDFLLGPTNDVLHGRAVLVGTASQYGIGPLYLLAGWFQIAPIGYGTLGLLDGILFGLFFAAGYGLVRIAGTPRSLAASAMALAVVALVYNLVFSVGNLPQHGPLRFGLPLAVVLAATFDAHREGGSRSARRVQLAVLGMAAIWSLECFAYTAATFAALACFQAWMRPGAERLAWLARRTAWAVAACVAAHLAFAAATLAFTGHLPDYGWYLAFLDTFLFGAIGEFTYDFAPWSPGLPVGVGYATSAAAVVLLTRRRPDVANRERVALTALVGTTAYGIALFSYLVDRSGNDIVPYVSFPLLLAGVLWIAVLLRGGGSRTVRLGGVAFMLLAGLLVLATAWSSVAGRFPQSPLAEAAPGGTSVRASLERLWHLPAIDGRAPEGRRLLDLYMPRQQRVLTLVAPDLEAEILMGSGRANRFPISFSTEDSFVGSHYFPALRRTVAELRPGQRLLMQVAGLNSFALLKAQPARGPFTDPVAPGSLSPLQAWILQRIAERFDLGIVNRGRGGFVVVRLVPRA